MGRRNRNPSPGARWTRSRYVYRVVDEEGDESYQSYHCDLILEARTDQEECGWSRIRVYLNQQDGLKHYADYILLDGRYSKKVS